MNASRLPVVAVDMLADKLEMARLRGATHCIVASKGTDVAAQVQNVELRSAAQQIRSINAAAGQMPAP